MLGVPRPQPVAAAGPGVSATIDTEVQAAADAGPVRVLVELTAATPSTTTSDHPRSLTNWRDLVAAQDRVARHAVATNRASTVRRFERQPLVALTAERSQLAAIAAEPSVRRIRLDRVRHADLAQSVPMVGAPPTWALGSDGSGQAVAILDTGIDKNHPFLAGKVISEACFSSTTSSSTSVCPGGSGFSAAPNSARPCPVVTVGNLCDHGTHVAGIVAGSSGPSTAPSGVAPGAKIVAIQVFSRFNADIVCGVGRSPCVSAWDSDIIAGLEYVSGLQGTLGVNIAAANLSLGGSPTVPGTCNTEPHKPAIDVLAAQGIATVVASGNAGNKNGVSSPACISTAISVGASSDTSSSVPSFSNSAPSLKLLGPGANIRSSIPGGEYASYNGTSMATPHVAAAFALLRSTYPTLGVSELLSMLRSTGTMVLDTANDVATPRIRVDTAMRPPRYIPLDPARVLDTRDGTGAPATRLGPNSSITVQLAGRGGIPTTGATAVALNLAAINPTQTSFITAYPTGTTKPLASNLNLTPGLTTPNLVIAKLGANGTITLYNNSGTVDLIADITGWYDTGGATTTGARYLPLDPTRVLDTRDGTGAPATRLGPNSSITVQLTGRGGIPTTGATAVALNLAAINPTQTSFITAYPTGTTKPLASNLNLTPGLTTPNLVIAKLGANGTITLYNNSGTVDLIADITGWVQD
jgi:subtilisin family serine protease